MTELIGGKKVPEGISVKSDEAVTFYDLFKPDPDEFYYFCLTASGSGAIARVMRGPGIGGPGMDYDRAAITEFYALDGSLLDRQSKAFQTPGMFALKFTDEVTRAGFYELNGRPDFISAPNNSYRNSEGALRMPAGRPGLDRMAHEK